MASILRSGKFVRYFAGLTRNILVNTAYKTEGNLVQNQQCTCSIISHGFATAVPKPDQNLDRSLKRLDQDVRRTGRISRRDIEEVLEEIRNQRSATSSQSLLVIRCCGNLVPEESPEVRTQLVQEIWKTLNTLNVPMDISHYNALLRVYLENEHQFSPTEFLADLEAKGVEPNRVTYQRLIARYCQEGDIEGATRILEFMKDKQLPVNEHVFNSLILGHSQANDLESAASILSVMKQAGLEPSADTYTTLLCCYGRHGDLDAIMKTLDECEKNEIHLLDKDILDIIYSLTINGHGEKIDPLFEKIRKSAGYNQDAVNTILRLTNKGYEDVAFKILQTMPRASKADGELADTGSFFIRQLVKANRPIEKIIKICNELKEKNLNSKALLIATEASLTNGLTNIAYPLLKELKSNGLPVRQHFFWPLICSVSSNEILNILRNMNEEFGISPNSETIRDYVIPNLKEKNSEKIIALLRTTGVSTATATSSTVYNALMSNKLKEAADIAVTTNAFYNPTLFRRPLIQALGKTNDFDSYIKLVRQIYDGLLRSGNVQQNQQQDEEEGEHNLVSNQYNQGEVLGQIVYDAVIYFKTNRAKMLEKILSGLVEQGLSISNAQAERIQERIGSEMNTKISELLGKLSAGDLEPLPIERPERSRRSNFENMSVEQLEEFIGAQEAKNENTKGLKRYLLNACFKTKDLEKTEEVLKKLEAEDYVLTSGIYAQLIDLYCYHNKLDEALQTYEKIKSKEPDFVLDNLKTVKVVDLLIKNKRIDDAIKFLDANHKENKMNEENSFNYNTTCWRVLNFLAETGNADDLKRIFEALESKNYINVNNVLLGPLVKVHIVNNDLKSAIDTFEEICNKYQATPWKNELACRLIQTEDATNLQRLTDLSTNIHGEVNSLYDLVFSFVECGRIRQARKILETPGLRSRPQRINSACERYRQEGMVESLEGLVEATKDLNHIDRSDIYYNLLLTYWKEDQPDKALGLWTKMQEDDITPSDMFLIKLAEFLKEKNMEIPFVVPTITPAEQKNVKEIERKPKTTTPPASPVGTLTPLQNFKKILRSGDIDKALEIKQKFLSSNDFKLSITDQSLLIEGLLKADRISEATKIVNELLDQNLHPVARIFKFYLNKLAKSGDIKTIEEIEKKIDPEFKKVLSFDNRYCNAYIMSGKTESYLNKLSEDIEKAKSDDEIKAVIEKFPRGGALGILEKHPEYCDKFTKIAEKYLAKGAIGPINILWIYYFIQGNDAKSKEIFDKYLESSPRIMFQRILQTCREKQDEQLIQKLISYLKRTKISDGAIGNAYSCYLDILTSKEKYDEALEVLKKAIDDVCLENFNRTALQRVKNGLEMKGKTFPYQIPEKNTGNVDTSSSSTSSSSSSDDDIKPSVPETKPVEPEKPKS